MRVSGSTRGGLGIQSRVKSPIRARLGGSMPDSYQANQKPIGRGARVDQEAATPRPKCWPGSISVSISRQNLAKRDPRPMLLGRSLVAARRQATDTRSVELGANTKCVCQDRPEAVWGSSPESRAPSELVSVDQCLTATRPIKSQSAEGHTSTKKPRRRGRNVGRAPFRSRFRGRTWPA